MGDHFKVRFNGWFLTPWLYLRVGACHGAKPNIHSGGARVARALQLAHPSLCCAKSSTFVILLLFTITILTLAIQ